MERRATSPRESTSPSAMPKVILVADKAWAKGIWAVRSRRPHGKSGAKDRARQTNDVAKVFDAETADGNSLSKSRDPIEIKQQHVSSTPMMHHYRESAKSSWRGSIRNSLRTDILGHRDTMRRYQRQDGKPNVPSELRNREFSCHPSRDNGDSSEYCQHGDGCHYSGSNELARLFSSLALNEPISNNVSC